MVIFLYFEFFHLYILWVFFFFFFLLHAFPNFIPILKYFEIDSINVYFSFNLASFSVLVIFQLVILVHQLQQISVSWHSNISNFHLISFHLIFRIYFISALLPINKNVFFNSFSFSSQLHTLHSTKHWASNVKIMSSFQEMHELIKCIPWMQCKSL